MLKLINQYRTGIILGFINTSLLLLLAYLIFPLPDHIEYHHFFSAGSVVMLSAFFTGSMASGLIINYYFIIKSPARVQCHGAIAGSILISPLSFYGGLFFSEISMIIGILLAGDMSIINYFVIFIGHVLGITFFECVGAIIGFALGSFLQKLLQRSS